MPEAKLTPSQKADAARLKAIYVAKKKKDQALTQEALADLCGWNSQGAVSQYLNGVIALNVDAALKFSRALGCPVADFSPHLADQIREGSAHAVEVEPGSHRLPIRRARFKLSAGITGYEIDYDHDEGEPIFMALRWFREKRYRPERLLAIRVSGRSMEPSLYDGDLVIVNTDDVALTDGEVFAANYEGELALSLTFSPGGGDLAARPALF